MGDSRLDQVVDVVHTIARMAGIDGTSPGGEARRVTNGPQITQYGYWGVIYGHGLAAEQLAHRALQQCLDEGLAAEIHAVDQFEPGDSIIFQALVLVLPFDLPLDKLTTAKRRFLDIVAAYRNRRKDGW